MTDNTTVLIKEHIRTLVDMAEGLDVNDLTHLAKMHEHVEQMEKLCHQLPDQLASAFAPVCKEIARADEDIILEVSSNPKGSLDGLCSIVKQLVELSLDPETPTDVILLERLLGELQELSGQNDKTKAGSTSGEPLSEDVPGQAEEWDQDSSGPASGQQTKVTGKPQEDYVQEPLHISDEELEYVKSFVAECGEHLENGENLLLSIEQSPDDLEQINELFRPFHTIKGMAGFLNLKDINALTHALETLLDLARKGKLKLTPEKMDVIFDAVDVLKVQVSAVAEYVAQPDGKEIPMPPIDELIQRVHGAATSEPTKQPPAQQKGQRRRLGEILVEEHHVTPELVEFALDKQQVEKKPVGEILTAMGAVKIRDVKQALRKQKSVQEAVVRIDTVKLDNLINVVGELVIAQAQVAQLTATASVELRRQAEEVSKITRDVQEIAMSMRMVPIAQTFHKMGRVTRDIARKGGKEITFVIEGEETELDKNVIQEISDPLMHMVRNAVDHGVESPEKRVEAGKPTCGMVKLNAYHQGGNIVIEVSDDGKGLDKEVLLKKGIEKGLVSTDAQLTDQQIYQLIMHAGFSTAEKVTDISGRGVGMDVVKRNIEKLRGKVEIQSAKGEGTTFIIRLPLTLAVIDGMIVRCGAHKFIIPTLAIDQAVLPTREQISTVQGKGRLLNLRGELYPLIALAELFDIPDGTSDSTQGMVVIAHAEEQKIGILLDELLGQQQVVIKSLGEQFRNVQGVSGAAILGDGTVGLILEPAGLLDAYRQPDAA